MRVLFLASYFPRPSKPLIGTWALEQARALSRGGDVRVVCCTPYIPRIMGTVPRAKDWIHVPSHHVWPATGGASMANASGIDTTYLKGLYYPLPPFNRWAHRNPARQMAIAWRSIRHRLLQIVDDFRPEVVFCHHTAVNGFFAEHIQRLRNLPFLVTDHDFHEISDCEHLRMRRAFFEPIKTAASQSICVAKRMEADTRRIFPACHTVTVHNGINPLPPEIFVTPRPAELHGKQIILSVGMFAERKAFPLLIEAFKRISGKYPQAVLRIIGDGKERPAIEAAIMRHQLTEKVTLLGLKPPKEVFQEMAWADLFALISWDEPFATVFVEAMGAGLPVIAASDGGITDVVQDGVHGLIVPPKDVPAAAEALDAMLSNEPGRREMGKRACAMVENQLTWDANAKRMYKLFEEAIQDRAAPVRV